MTIELGGAVPDVELATTDGGRLALRAFVGRPFVLFFYPKDDTPGCTSEAQDFSRLGPEFKALGVELLGVSRDTTAKHLKFIAKHDLTVALASDDTGTATEAFGVWVEKQLYGRSYWGIDRSTWLFAADGTLARAWRKVRVPGHAETVLEAVGKLGK